MPKTEIEIEALLLWAYRDELSKRRTSAAEGIWDRIQDYSNHGGIDRGHGAAQRYSHFGLPDPDAEAIERAVSALPDVAVDWGQSLSSLAGDLAPLVDPDYFSAASAPIPTAPQSSWGTAGAKALRAFFGKDGANPIKNRRHAEPNSDSIRTSVLVTMHAIRGTRPDWTSEFPHPYPTAAERGPNAKIIGECRGRNIYSLGAHCPLKWSPAPSEIIIGRADYAVWHAGLERLAATLDLKKFVALPPKAAAMPWLDGEEESSRIVPVMPTGKNSASAWGTLPLAPGRDRTARAPSPRRASPVRYPLADHA